VPRSAAGEDETPPAQQGTRGGKIAPFSLAPRVVTRTAFAAFVKTTGYTAEPGTGDEECATSATTAAPPAPAGAGADPVVCVDWKDAMAYINWLNQLSGLKFRLPTAGEWRYAAGLRRPPTSEAGDADGEPGPAGAEAAAAADRMLVPGPAEWVSDCAEQAGGGDPDAAAERTDGSPCARHLVLNPTIAGATQDGLLVLPVAHENEFRAIDLGFRLAL
jgi:hypothetical protein